MHIDDVLAAHGAAASDAVNRQENVACNQQVLAECGIPLVEIALDLNQAFFNLVRKTLHLFQVFLPNFEVRHQRRHVLGTRLFDLLVKVLLKFVHLLPFGALLSHLWLVKDIPHVLLLLQQCETHLETVHVSAVLLLLKELAGLTFEPGRLLVYDVANLAQQPFEFLNVLLCFF